MSNEFMSLDDFKQAFPLKCASSRIIVDFVDPLDNFEVVVTVDAVNVTVDATVISLDKG